MNVRTYDSKHHSKNKQFSLRYRPKEALFTILGVVSILIGIFLVIPALLPLLKLVFGIILLSLGYFVVSKNSNLFYFKK